MCRWPTYSGPALPLSALLTRPHHSLIDQSRRARQSAATTNGDGFGVGWYGESGWPGGFHDTHPAWNSANLRHLARHVSGTLCLAHIRAATGTPVQETNCHPFAFEGGVTTVAPFVPRFE